MKILKIINNNVLSAMDNGAEVVVMGRGIGFGVSKGQEVDAAKIRKVFRLGNKDTSDKFAQMLSDIPLEHIQVASDVIDYLKENFDKKLNKNIYVTLTDHISFAIERFQNGMVSPNPLLFDVKTFYPAEFEMGQKALSIIKQHMGIAFPDDEAASVALHIVNAEYGTEISQIMHLTEIIGEIVNIIEQHLDITIKDESLDFSRLVTHLKFFLLRLEKNEKFSTDNELNQIIKTKYVEAYNCAKQIVSYVNSRFNGDIPVSELTYLAIHIQRLKERKNGF